MLRGHLDHATRRWIYGWAFDEAHPDRPAIVEIRIDGDLVARLTANLARGDLEAAIGAARHGFELFLPGLCALHRHVVSARIAESDSDLENSPIIIERATAFDTEVEASLAQMIANGDVPTLERATLTMSEMIETSLDRRAALQTHREARDLRYRWFAARGSTLQPQLAPKRALLVLPERGALRDADIFLAENHAGTLRELGFDVALATGDLAGLGASEREHLMNLGVDLPCRPFVASIEELLWRQRHGLDVVLLFGVGMASRYRSLAQAHAPRAKVLTIALVDEPDASRGDTTTIWSAPWAVSLKPDGRTFEMRRGLVVLDDPATLPPVVRDLLAAAIDEVHAENPDLPVEWLAGHRAAGSGSNTAQAARIALTLETSPRAYRDAVRAFARGLPCIAPRALLASLGLPSSLAVCDTAKASGIASAILRLHEDEASHAFVRKCALDHLDFHHAPEAVARAWRLALRTKATTAPAQFIAPGMRNVLPTESLAC